MPVPAFLTLPVVAVLDHVTAQHAYHRFWIGFYGPAAAMVDGKPRVNRAEYEAARGKPISQREYDLALARKKTRLAFELRKRGEVYATKRAEVRKSIPSISSNQLAA
jgi:hypothetical protein